MIRLARLKAAFHSALRAARWSRKKLVIEIFSGSGRLATAVRHRGYAALCLDIKFGDEFDITNSDVRNLIRGWISSGAVLAVHLAPPCSSWSTARHGPIGTSWGPIRSHDCPSGLPGISSRDADKVRAGNRTAAAAAWVFRLCMRFNVPVSMENPSSSIMWASRYFASLVAAVNDKSSHITSSTLDFCAFGEPWRKRTRFLLGHCIPWKLQSPLCTGHDGMCSFTHRRHIILRGHDETGVPWTKRAEPYPKRMCTSLATVLTQSAEANSLIRMTNLVTQIAC